MKSKKVSEHDLKVLNSRTAITDLLRFEKLNFSNTISYLDYRRILKELQAELLKMQLWISENQYRLAIIFEGRDLAGKGGCIRWFTEHLSPRSYRSVALPAPSEVEKGQWYFQRYIHELPNPGEIVLFDRSWYNRAVVEPVNNLCSKQHYDLFMHQVAEFEDMLHEDGIKIIKFWLSISKNEQKKRLEAVKDDPLASWKLSGLDKKALKLWDEYTRFKKRMLERTDLPFSKWMLLNANYVPAARVETIKHVLANVPYPKNELSTKLLKPDTKIISTYKGD